MTKLIFLGSTSAMTVAPDNYQSNMLLVSDDGSKLLIDCGSDIRFSLYDVGLSYLHITDIYLSNLHSDKVGGLEYIAFATKFDPRCNKPKLYVSKDMAGDLWPRSLSGGLRYVEGDITDLDTFFELNKIGHDGNYFEWQGLNIGLVRTISINTNYSLMPSYGLFWEIEGTKVILTLDSEGIENLMAAYEQADIIFQDCETSAKKSGIHSHYDDLSKLPDRIRSKMWLYNYDYGYLPDAVQAGFRGWVKRGQEFDFSLVGSYF